MGSYLVPYAFTLIFMLSIFITSGYLLQSVTEEKENRVVEILLSSIPALPLMAGKVLGLGAAGLTQVAIWVATALIALPLINNQFSLNVHDLAGDARPGRSSSSAWATCRTARSTPRSVRLPRARARHSSTRASSASSP